MSVHSYEDLREHLGHTIECAYYGDRAEPANVALECMDCSVVLVDFDRPGEDEQTARGLDSLQFDSVYSQVCEVIDGVKNDEPTEDTDIYAARIMEATGR